MENKQVAVYIRVGNASQLQERAELHKNALEKYAKQQGLEVVRQYIDLGHSGKNLDRPGMQDLLADIERGQVDTVLVMNRSHLSRNPMHRNFPCNVISLVEDVKYIAESNRVAAVIRQRMAYIDERKQAAKAVNNNG